MARPNGSPADASFEYSNNRSLMVDLDTFLGKAVDTPTKQLLYELGRQQDEYDKDVNLRLERESLERANQHRALLEAAAAEHERIRQDAERAYELYHLRQENNRRLEEEEQKRALAKARQEAVEREIQGRRNEIEEARRLEERRLEAAEARREAEAEAERVRTRQQEDEQAAQRRLKEQEDEQRERARRAEEESLRRAREAREPNTNETAPSTAAPPQISSQSVANTANSGTLEEKHQKYLILHQRLKEMRKNVLAQGKQNPELKKRMGDGRREIVKCAGQLVNDRAQNKTPQNKINSLLRDALTFTQPSIDVRPFIVSQIPQNVNQDHNQVPALFIYLLNIFSKAMISQLISEAGVALKAADPAGILTISIFASTDFRWQGVPMIDILLAKYHVVCPVLFGIYGSERTEAGRKRLGWQREDGAWVSEQRHSERMTGLGAGFAAVSLRNFSKATISNPLPPYNYWQAFACIVNTPPKDITQTHCIVLKALIENHAALFIGFFGQAAVVALRKAVVEFPKQAPQSSASSALSTLATSLQRNLHLTL